MLAPPQDPQPSGLIPSLGDPIPRAGVRLDLPHGKIVFNAGLTLEGHAIEAFIEPCSGRIHAVAYTHHIERCSGHSESRLAPLLQRTLKAHGWVVAAQLPQTHERIVDADEAAASDQCACITCADGMVLVDRTCVDPMQPGGLPELFPDSTPREISAFLTTDPFAVQSQCTCSTPYSIQTWTHPERPGEVRIFDEWWETLSHHYSGARATYVARWVSRFAPAGRRWGRGQRALLIGPLDVFDRGDSCRTKDGGTGPSLTAPAHEPGLAHCRSLRARAPADRLLPALGLSKVLGRILGELQDLVI